MDFWMRGEQNQLRYYSICFCIVKMQMMKRVRVSFPRATRSSARKPTMTRIHTEIRDLEGCLRVFMRFSLSPRGTISGIRIHAVRSNIYREMRFVAEIPVSLPGVASGHDFA